MEKKIVLHLGIHKTATTSLQEFLENNRSALRKHGASFMPLDEMRANVSPLIRSHNKTDRETLSKLITRSGAQVDIFSDENLMGLTSDIRVGTLYPHADGRVTRFCEQFKDLPVEVVITLRSPAKFILSSYSEYIRHHPFEDFDSYISNYPLEDFSIANELSWVWDLPENARVTILPFEVENGGGVSFITNKILELACGEDHDISIENFPRSKIRSVFTREEIDLGSEIAKTVSTKAAKAFMRMIGFEELRFGEETFNPLPKSTITALEKRYVSDLKMIASKQKKRAVI